MIAIDLEVTKVYNDTDHEVRAFIVASTEPDSFPINGSDIENMTSRELLAPFSIIYVVETGDFWISNEEREFVKQTSAGGGDVTQEDLDELEARLTELISEKLKREIVEELPSDPDSNTIYMILSEIAAEDNVYDEYMYIDGDWEIIGSTAVDLSNYVAKNDVIQGNSDGGLVGTIGGVSFYGVGKEGAGEGSEIFNDYENNTDVYKSGETKENISTSPEALTGLITFPIAYLSTSGPDIPWSKLIGATLTAPWFSVTQQTCHIIAVDENAKTITLDEAVEPYPGPTEPVSLNGSEITYYDNATTANYAHIEGQSNIAAVDYQHVQGRYNSPSSVYADIVGNGTSAQRSNAYTLDWDGNATFAGRVTVGLDPVNNMDVATKYYVDNASGGVTVEQGIIVGTYAQNNSCSHPVGVIDGTTVYGAGRVVLASTSDPRIKGFDFGIGNTVDTGNSYQVVPCFVIGTGNIVKANERGSGVAMGYYNVSNSECTLAAGYGSTANTRSAIAFGEFTRATGQGSLSAGIRTTASGDGSHAEGYQTNAQGHYSHAEGSETTAFVNGRYNHAEGWQTLAGTTASHSEGYKTTAFGKYSHSEGVGNMAVDEGSHVSGRYADDTTGYAFVVGNGTSAAASNGYTLDWNGNGVYAGKLTVGQNPVNNMDVATKEYVDNSGGGSIVTGTLTAGNTTLTLTDASITTDSMIDIYTDIYGIAPTAIAVATGSITLTFAALSSDLGVKVKVT